MDVDNNGNSLGSHLSAILNVGKEVEVTERAHTFDRTKTSACNMR